MARTKPIAQLNDWRLFQLGSSRWSLRWTDSRGKHRITFHASSLESAIVEAHRVRESDTRKGQPYRPNPIAKPKPVERIRISDALLRSAESREWTDEYRKKDRNACRYFLNWIDGLGFHWWDELRLETVEAYVKYLRDKKNKPMTLQHYLKPVKRTAAWVSANFYTANICQSLVLPRLSRSKNIRVMSLHEGLDFLDWLTRIKPCKCIRHCQCVKRQRFFDRLVPGVALQLLLGLRLKEALNVTWGDIEQDTLKVRGRKNQYSHRILPVPGVTMHVLRSWGHDGNTVVKPYSHYAHYSQALKKALLLWRPQQTDLAPKDLRKTLFREAKRRGFYSSDFESFMGHATSQMLDVTRRYYDYEQTEAMVSVYRRNVLPFIEEGIASWSAPTDTAILPGPSLELFKISSRLVKSVQGEKNGVPETPRKLSIINRFASRGGPI